MASKKAKPSSTPAVQHGVDANSPGFLEAAPDAIVIVGADGCIQLINGQAERLFGYQRAELLGQRVEILIPSRYWDQHPALRNGYFGDPRPRPMGAGVDL